MIATGTAVDSTPAIPLNGAMWHALPLLAVVLLVCGCSRGPRLERTRPATADKTFLVTPTWTGDSSRLLAAGRGGVGLHRVELPTGALKRVDPSERTPRRHEPTGPLGAAVASTEDGGLVWFHPYPGRIVAAGPGGEQVLEDAEAWGVVATSGGRVAWCRGPLAHATITVYGPERGIEELGHGAQPAWVTGQDVLVFARPEADPDTGEVVASDLWAWTAASGETRRLTETPGVTEMEPAPSPDGRRLAFSDWRSGQVLVGDWSGP